MANAALLIAIEEYADPGIPPVRYAAADLAAFSAALQPLGFPETLQLRRLNAAATSAMVAADVRSLLERLSPDDSLILFIVGHGFSSGNRNYLACHDTRLSDPLGTSFPLQELFHPLEASGSPRVSVFLDVSHGGLPVAASSSGPVVAEWDDHELETHFAAAGHGVCFSACTAGEVSHASSHGKHGIWTHHLLGALRDAAPSGAQSSQLVTASSLQSHLLQAVPRTLRAEFATPKRQTPRMFGQPEPAAAGELSPLFARPKAAAPALPRLDAIVITSSTRQPIKALSGFKKTHRVPDRKNSASQDFLNQISLPELQKDLDETFQNLKTIYRFKRLELEQRGPSEGGGVIITPFFEYSIAVELADDDPSKVVWHRQVRKITDSARVFSAEFDCVFSAVFDTIEIGTGRNLNVANVIDRIEDLETAEVSVTYDADCTACTIKLSGSQVAIRVTEQGLFIQDRQTTSPRKLLESAMDVQYRLTHEFGIQSLTA